MRTNTESGGPDRKVKDPSERKGRKCGSQMTEHIFWLS